MQRVSRQKHCSMALRGAIVGQYLAGISPANIARSLNVSKRTVKRWVDRHHNNNNLDRKPQPGQKRKLGQEQRDAVTKIIEENPFSNAAIVGRQFGVNKKTIRKVWRERGIKHGIAARKPKLTDAQKEERMGYALENLTRDWSNVIFSDEKTYQTDRHQKLHVYRPKNSRFVERYIHKTQRSGRITTGFWGWISRDGPGELTPISGRLNSDGYIEVLQDVLKPTVEICYGGFEEMVFMQDNCSVHTSKKCKAWFEANPDITRLVTPPNSPDLNPIENVWAETTRDWLSIFPRNLATLSETVKKNWEALRERPDYFRKIYDSMPARLNAVINANGGHTKY